MTQVSYILLGLAPSLIWLVYYLKKDTHPEPKRTILKIFLSGALAAVLAGIIETLLVKYIPPRIQGILPSIFFFGIIAFIEELLKYLPVRLEEWKDMELDEPIDISEYMITSGLGFATLENILLFFTKKLKFLETFLVSSFRFVGATFLHALCSGIFGYFIALSFCRRKTKRQTKARILFGAGFATAVLLHTLYNFSIIKIGRSLGFLFPILLIGVSALVLSLSLKHLQKLKSICKE